jgi:Xaa-Pro aminopeptidase
MRGLNVEAYSWHVLSGSSACSVTDSDTPCGGQGMSPAFPRGASTRRIRAHEPVMVDVPVCYNGYLADQTRIFCIGRLPDKFRNAYEFCREVQRLTIEKARPGVDCEEVFLLGQSMARDRGYDKCYLGLEGNKTAFVGHGIGLDVNEAPVLGLGQNYPVQSGTVVAIEPKVVFPEEGAVGIESMFHIMDDGYEKLTSVDDGIFEI